MSNVTVVVKKDVPFEFYTMQIICDSSKSWFGLVVGKSKLRMADPEVLADSVGNVFKKLSYDGKWNRVGVSKDDGIKGGF